MPASLFTLSLCAAGRASAVRHSTGSTHFLFLYLSSTSHPPIHTACGLTRDGDGNPGTILVRWLGPAVQCLIGQLVLVMSPPGWTYQRYYWLCNQSLCAPVASPMRWLAPVLAHPCSPSLSSCLPTRHPPPLLVRLRKVFGTWGHLAPLLFAIPLEIFFYFSRERSGKKSKKESESVILCSC
jgi:hypothetical protein